MAGSRGRPRCLGPPFPQTGDRVQRVREPCSKTVQVVQSSADCRGPPLGVDSEKTHEDDPSIRVSSMAFDKSHLRRMSHLIREGWRFYCWDQFLHESVGLRPLLSAPALLLSSVWVPCGLS